MLAFGHNLKYENLWIWYAKHNWKIEQEICMKTMAFPTTYANIEYCTASVASKILQTNNVWDSVNFSPSLGWFHPGTQYFYTCLQLNCSFNWPEINDGRNGARKSALLCASAGWCGGAQVVADSVEERWRGRGGDSSGEAANCGWKLTRGWKPTHFPNYSPTSSHGKTVIYLWPFKEYDWASDFFRNTLLYSTSLALTSLLFLCSMSFSSFYCVLFGRKLRCYYPCWVNYSSSRKWRFKGRYIIRR